MRREIQEPATNERGDEVHPAFGMVRATRPSSTPGQVLFDSEIRHQHYITLEVSRATRGRDLNHDWIHPGKTVLQVDLSEAQWASMVSSIGSSGVPCTIRATETAWDVPGLPFAPRLAISQAETHEAAQRAFEHIKEKFAAVEEKPTKANIRALRAAIENAPRNVEWAAESLTKHVENVVQKARADVEAMVVSKAKQLGVDPAELGELAIGDAETKELEG